jgi:hypothetical protein
MCSCWARGIPFWRVTSLLQLSSQVTCICALVHWVQGTFLHYCLLSLLHPYRTDTASGPAASELVRISNGGVETRLHSCICVLDILLAVLLIYMFHFIVNVACVTCCYSPYCHVDCYQISKSERGSGITRVEVEDVCFGAKAIDIVLCTPRFSHF